jgi:hypothetical protein
MEIENEELRMTGDPFSCNGVWRATWLATGSQFRDAKLRTQN